MHHRLLGSSRLVALWPEFSTSPTSRLLATSPLVASAVKRNEHLFTLSGSRPSARRDPYAKMMAVHIRRGDFEEACTRLANYNSTFYGWNLLPDLPDPFILPSPDFELGHNTPENIRAYLIRCLPTNDYLIRKIGESKEQWESSSPGQTLDTMFIMTNADQAWIKQFTSELRKEGFYSIVTTQDFVYDDEQTAVNMAVDMDIGRRAAVFIGNGVLPSIP